NHPWTCRHPSWNHPWTCRLTSSRPSNPRRLQYLPRSLQASRHRWACPRRGRIARGVAIGHAPGDRSLRRELGGAVPLGPDQTCAFEQLLTAAVLVAHVGLGVTEVTL